MKPLAHVAFTTPIAALAAWKAGVEPAACFACGAILIDLDHYIFFVLRSGCLNPVSMFAWFDRVDSNCTPQSYYGLQIFHTAEAFILVAIAAGFRPVISWLLLGMGFHLLLDVYWLWRHPVLGVKMRAYSWTEHFVRRIRGEREVWRER